MPRTIVIREDNGRPAALPEGCLAFPDRRTDGRRSPARLDQRPVEHEVGARREACRGFCIPVEQLADGHPAGLLVEDRAESPDQRREVGLVAIVQVDLAIPRRPAGPGRVGRQVRVLEEQIEDVEAEAVHAASEPSANHPELGLLDACISPVQLRLLDHERVEVELAPTRLPLPAAATEERCPVVRRQGLSAIADAGRVAPEIPIRVGSIAARARRLEPFVRVARMVHDEIEDDPDAPSMRLGHEPIEHGLRPEDRIDPVVIGDVIAPVEAGRRVDGRQPDRVDAEPVGTQVVEVLDDPGQVTDTVAVRVGEAARVDLVNHPALPPVGAEPGAPDGRDVPAHPGLPAIPRQAVAPCAASHPA
jgi:hypothetical protein